MEITTVQGTMKGWRCLAVAWLFVALLPPAAQARWAPHGQAARAIAPAAVPSFPAAAAAAPAASPATAPAAASAAAPAATPAGAPPVVRPTPGSTPTMTQEWAPHYPGIEWGSGDEAPVPGSSWYRGPLVREGPVAHAVVPGRQAGPEQHRVILRGGASLAARSQPRLAGGTVRFTDERGTLVSIRASEVDLAATAAANHLAWPTAPAQAPAPAPAARPGSPPH